MPSRDVFICGATRTPIGRYGGSLSSIRADDLAAIPIRNLINGNESLNPTAIDDVILGCANQAGEDNRNIARMSSLLAGLPVSVPGCTINRLCGSGMDAVSMGFRSIVAGEADVIIAGGVESMSRAPLVVSKSSSRFGRDQKLYDTTMGWRFINPKFEKKFGVHSMPETAEKVAAKYAIKREDQDKFALRSHQRAILAQENALFDDEIIPMRVPQTKKEDIIVSVDQGPRADTNLFQLKQLPTPFKENGTVTAGNASSLNDGACAILLASLKAVYKYQLKPLAKVVGGLSIGVEPQYMGIGPGPAALKLLSRLDLSIEQMGVIEINEAFAAQALAVTRMLGLQDNDIRVNSQGGSIALGHPLGMSGARLLTTASYRLLRNKERYALCAMCIGVGQGIAMIIENAKL